MARLKMKSRLTADGRMTTQDPFSREWVVVKPGQLEEYMKGWRSVDVITQALVEVSQARKRRTQKGLEIRMATAVGRQLSNEGKAMVKALAPFSDLVDQNAAQVMAQKEAVGDLAILDQAIMGVLSDTAVDLQTIITEGHVTSWVAGASDSARALSSNFFYLKADPRALDYAEAFSGARVTAVHGHTRNKLGRMTRKAILNGDPWNVLAKDIRDQYKKWAGTTDRRASLSTVARSVRIAKFEIGDAYEQGNLEAAGDLWAAGVDLLMMWLTRGNSRVRDSHRANERQGWIPFGGNWSSGDRRPPTDPGCGCSLLFQRA